MSAIESCREGAWAPSIELDSLDFTSVHPPQSTPLNWGPWCLSGLLNNVHTDTSAEGLVCWVYKLLFVAPLILLGRCTDGLWSNHLTGRYFDINGEDRRYTFDLCSRHKKRSRTLDSNGYGSLWSREDERMVNNCSETRGRNRTHIGTIQASGTIQATNSSRRYGSSLFKLQMCWRLNHRYQMGTKSTSPNIRS